MSTSSRGGGRCYDLVSWLVLESCSAFSINEDEEVGLVITESRQRVMTSTMRV
jgi:hypothetical protein